MDAAGPLSHGAQTAGAIAVALLAALALVVTRPRPRAALMAATYLVVPALLVADIWDRSQFRPLRDRPLIALILALIIVAVVAAGTVLFDRRPSWFAMAAVAMVPFRIPIESGGSSSNLLVPLYVVIAAGVGAFVLAAVRGRAGEDEHPRGLEWALALVLVLYAVQASYSEDSQRALEQILFFYGPFALLFVLLRRARWTAELARRCGTIIVVLALGFAAVGFAEYATRTVFLNPRIVASNEFESYFRVNSLFFDPNIYGRFLMIAMLCLVATLLWSARRVIVLGSAAILTILFAGLVLTLSQSSFSALLVGMAVLAGAKWNPRKAGMIAGVVVALAVIVVVVFSAALKVDVHNGKTLSQNTSGRSELVRGGLHLFEAKPVAGQGSASFERRFRSSQHVSAQRALSASHTIPVTVAAEQGLIGLLPYLTLLVLAFMRLAPGSSRDAARAAIVAAFAALVFHTFLYASFLEDPLVWVLLGLGTAAVAAQRDRSITVGG